MRRNDLTSEEVRFERLLRSLDRGPAAPDPEFLRTLREMSTAAFIAAQPVRPHATRVARVPPPNPLLGRRRLRSLRVAMFSSVAALLLFGMLSPALFPSRGIELGVALDNLKRANSYEIEFQTGAGSNTMLYARGADASARWRVDYASGNSEVSDGTATYFLNRGNNSIHPSPLEEETITPAFVEDKLMASLNVDPAVQSSLLKQRPETVVNQNGQPVLVYNYQAPDQDHPGQTLSINATVNAENKTLLAINSEVRDASGNSRFKANADVKSVNSAIPMDRFQLDPQAEPSEQIAMVEDVQGQAVVDDLTPLPVSVQALDGIAPQAELMNRAANGRPYSRNLQRGAMASAEQYRVEMSASTGAAAALSEEAVVANEPLREKQDGQALLRGPVAGEQQAPFRKSSPGPALTAEPRGKQVAGGVPLADSDQDRDEKPAAPRSRMLKGGPQLPGGIGGSGIGPPGAASARKLGEERRNQKLAAKDVLQLPAAAPQAAPAPVRRMAKGGSPEPAAELSATAEPSKREVTKSQNFLGQKAAPQNAARQGVLRQNSLEALEATQNGAVVDARSSMNREDAVELKRKSGFAAPGSRSQKTATVDAELEVKEQQVAAGAMDKQLRKAQAPEDRAAALSDATSSQGIAPLNSLPLMQRNVVARSDYFDTRNRSSEYGFVRRQVAPQSEVHPGGVLMTDPDASNVVWARLANDADLVVGPGSEVLLLKPTEVRLQAGELMLNVPPGDQVDLLGPEPTAAADADNNRLSNRRKSQQLRFQVSRQQVTGRGIFRIENNQLQRVDRDPPWLANYFARQTNAKHGTQSVGAQPAQSLGIDINSSSKPGAGRKSAAPPAQPQPQPK